jgi:hypothetical protein
LTRSAQEREQLTATIRTLAWEGYSSQQVAEKLGLERGAVSGLAKRAEPRIYFRAKPGAPPKPLHSAPVYGARKARLATVKAFGRSCCWAGCKAEPSGFGKPYCDRHAREAKGISL